MASLLTVSQAQVSTNVLNDGTTVAGLVRLENQNETGGAEVLLFADSAAGGLVAEQTEEFSGFPLHSAWYVSSIRVTKPVYSVSVSAKPSSEYPETRLGVMGWLDLDALRGIELRVRPNPGDTRFEVSVVNFGATSEAENDTQVGLYNLDGTAADSFSTQAEGGAYAPDAFAVFQLEFSAPTSGDLAVVADATARVTGRVFQASGGGPLAQVGGTIELLTSLPVPAQHQVGYYANWNSNLIPGSTIGTLRLLTVVGEIIQVNQKPVVTLTSPLPGATVREPGSFDLAATANDPDGTVIKVDFLKGAEVVGTVATPPYQFAVSNLVAGNYQFAARATDNEGATTSSEPVTVTVTPNQPPVVAITSPLDGTQFVAPASFDLVASASDPDGTISSVHFMRGVTSVGVATQPPYQVTITDLPVGTFTFVATATDDRGASKVSVPVTIQVRANQAPLVSITGPQPGAEFIAPAEFDFIAQASDLDGTVIKVDFFSGANLLGTVTESPFVFRVTGLEAGAHSLIARATDNRGAATSSAPVNILVRGNQPPVVALTNPANGAQFIAPTGFDLVASASDADGTIASVEFFRGEASLGLDTQAPYVWPVADLPVGFHIFTAKATDDRGATRISEAVTVEVRANQPPTVVITQPADGAKFDAPASFVLVATATDADGEVTKVEFLQDGVSLAAVQAPPYQVNVTDLAAGTYLFEVMATDERGVTSTPARITVEVVSLVVQPRLLNPTPLPSAENFQQLQVTISGKPGASYVVERTGDYVTWTAVETVTLQSATLVRAYPRDQSARLVVLRLREGSGPTLPPEISDPRPLPSAENFQQLAFTITGSTGATYLVEKTSDFVTWTLVETLTMPAPSVERVYPHQPGAGLVAYRVRSSGGGPVVPPELSAAAALPTPDNFQQFRFTANELAGKRYRVESSATLQSWTEVETGTAVADSVTFTYSKSAISNHLFYRVVILP